MPCRYGGASNGCMYQDGDPSGLWSQLVNLTPAFSETSQWIAYRTNHMELLSSPEVGRQMVSWLT